MSEKQTETLATSNDANNNFTQSEYSDFSDGYANAKQLFLSFYSYNANATINFKGFIMSYSDSYNSDWNEESGIL